MSYFCCKGKTICSRGGKSQRRSIVEQGLAQLEKEEQMKNVVVESAKCAYFHESYSKLLLKNNYNTVLKHTSVIHIYYVACFINIFSTQLLFCLTKPQID